ncbi:MAG: isocitrate/isopropylmalate family dehydrogenase, partial [Firmicutes bacterium]|nr:isocitrate/isopropylmalate family dehydrogenase [Bacillota bacterium]
TEDVYAGIEWASDSLEAQRLIAFLHEELGQTIDPHSAIGIKPMSPHASERIIRRALNYAVSQHKKRVTLMHKGNIMKYTEGGFREWGYQLAKKEFAGMVEIAGTEFSGRVQLNDRIADNLFQEVLLRPETFDVIATPNLNGDYLSDALAAQVGGLGMAPGANMSDTVALFEATHGTAPTLAGKDKANPGSLLLSAAMLLDHLQWNEAAQRVRTALQNTIRRRIVTEDLGMQMEDARIVGTKAFTEALLEAIER